MWLIREFPLSKILTIRLPAKNKSKITKSGNKDIPLSEKNLIVCSLILIVLTEWIAVVSNHKFTTNWKYKCTFWNTVFSTFLSLVFSKEINSWISFAQVFDTWRPIVGMVLQTHRPKVKSKKKCLCNPVSS